MYVSAAKSRTQKNSIDKHGDGFETQTHPNSQASAQEYDGTVDHRRNFDGFNDFLLSLSFFFISVVSVLSRRDILSGASTFSVFLGGNKKFLSYSSEESLHLLHLPTYV